MHTRNDLAFVHPEEAGKPFRPRHIKDRERADVAAFDAGQPQHPMHRGEGVARRSPCDETQKALT
jgi:hypothetical protein